jgi:hypothetical protein
MHGPRNIPDVAEFVFKRGSVVSTRKAQRRKIGESNRRRVPCWDLWSTLGRFG